MRKKRKLDYLDELLPKKTKRKKWTKKERKANLNFAEHYLPTQIDYLFNSLQTNI